MRRIFVTGIGTDVGKTIAAAILTEALEADYWKPVQSGAADGTDNNTVKKLVSNKKSQFYPERYLLQAPVSPHLAAELEGKEILLQDLQLPETNNTLIIEGAGGLLVPLNSANFVIDLITRFEAEAVLVVKHYLGSINHTLLSIEALKSRNCKIAGIIFNGEAHEPSEKVIRNHHYFPFIGRINNEPELSAETIARYRNSFSQI